MKWDGAVTATLVMCALVSAGLVVRQVFAPSTKSAPPASQPEFIDGWRSHLSHGVQLGSAEAPIQLMEFADFECPFCASFDETLKKLQARYPKEVTLSYVHYPLPGHRFAELGARAAECADRQGRFAAMHDRLFEQQRKLGLRPWADFARDAGVADLATFEACMDDSAPLPRIEAGKQLGASIGIRGTPTLVINGWKLARPPTADELDRMVKAILSGKSPVAVE